MDGIFSVDRGDPPLNSSFFSFSLNQFFGEIFTVKVDPRNKELTTEKTFFYINGSFEATAQKTGNSYS